MTVTVSYADEGEMMGEIKKYCINLLDGFAAIGIPDTTFLYNGERWEIETALTIEELAEKLNVDRRDIYVPKIEGSENYGR